VNDGNAAAVAGVDDIDEHGERTGDDRGPSRGGTARPAER
jgi:hypothetical protein